MRNGLVWVAGTTAGAALLTYAFLVLVTRGLEGQPAEADQFATFWSASLILGAGFFIPLEQLMAHRTAAGADPRTAVRASLAPAAQLLGLALGGLVLAWPVLSRSAGDDALPLAALLALFAAVSAVQYLGRGAALGAGRLGAYGGALLAENVLRATGAVLLLLLAARSSEAVAAVLAASVLLAHLPLLRAGRARAGAAGQPVPRDVIAGEEPASEVGVGDQDGGTTSTAGTASAGGTARAPLALLGASLCAQLLLNAGPVVVAAWAEPGAAIAFLAAFTIARAPLFLVVPVQSVLVPPLTRMVAEGRLHDLRVRMAALAGAVAAAAAAGGLLALLLSGVVELLYGPSAAVAPQLLAVLVAGSVVHGGLVLGTQALVATRRQTWAMLSWAGGLAAGAAVLVLPVEVSVRTALAFAVGSAVGWLLSLVVLVAPPASAPATARPATARSAREGAR